MYVPIEDFVKVYEEHILCLTFLDKGIESKAQLTNSNFLVCISLQPEGDWAHFLSNFQGGFTPPFSSYFIEILQEGHISV